MHVVKEKTFKNYRTEHSLDNQLKLSHKQHSWSKKRNMTFNRRGVDIVFILFQTRFHTFFIKWRM